MTELDHGYFSQQERREILENDKRLRNTYHAHAHPEEEFGGRFAATDLAKQNTVGSKPVVDYAGAPNWAQDPSGDEPPLGYSVEDHQAVGELFEQQASLGTSPADDANGQPRTRRLSSPPSRPFPINSAAQPPAEQGAARSSADLTPSVTVRSAPPTPSTFRRRI